MNLKTALKGKLSEKEFSLLKSSFDIVGDIAILEIPPELVKKERVIAGEILKIQKNVRTVCKKAGERKGVYRLRKYSKILGNSFETIHKESGCQFKLDISKAYFSVRESTERLRISSEIKKKEKILVLFSGVGPFGIVIAKKHTDCEIDMVEINPKACEYADENIRINKVGDRVRNFCGNIKKTHMLLEKYDRIIMPLPETGYNFLDIALEHCKKNRLIHLYSTVGEKDKKVEKTIKKYKALKILKKRKVLPYAPGVWKVCYDLRKI